MAASARLGSWMRWSSWTRSLAPFATSSGCRKTAACSSCPPDGCRRPRTRQVATGQSTRRFGTFRYATRSWSHKRRVVVKAEHLGDKANPRFVVTSVEAMDPRAIYETLYCPRGQAENAIKDFKRALAGDRCPAPRTLPTRSDWCCMPSPTDCSTRFGASSCGWRILRPTAVRHAPPAPAQGRHSRRTKRATRHPAIASGFPHGGGLRRRRARHRRNRPPALRDPQRNGALAIGNPRAAGPPRPWSA